MASTLTERFVDAERTTLTWTECERTLERTCFGHLAFNRPEQLDMLPIRFAYMTGWVYFRAGAVLRAILSRNPWMALGVTEVRDTDHFDSVIVRGGCYATEDTGSAAADAMALRGIFRLRDRPIVGRIRGARDERTSTVFRLHVDEMVGTTTLMTHAE